MTEKEKMLAGQLYDPSDPELDVLRLKARKLARKYNLTDEELQLHLPGRLPGPHRGQRADRAQRHPGHPHASAAPGGAEHAPAGGRQRL